MNSTRGRRSTGAGKNGLAAHNGFAVNRKRVSRLMALMGIEAVYPKPKLSQPGDGHRIYPYLLRGIEVERVNQVWSTEITYIRMAQGFAYLVAVMDWFNRFVPSWSLSLTMELGFCVEALKCALRRGRPEIFNSDQGRSSPARSSLPNWKPERSPSAWTDEDAVWTTFSSSDCGGHSNTRRCI